MVIIMNLYFGDIVSTITTVLVLSIIIYIVTIIAKHKKIELWGRQIALLVIWGLVVCILVAVRDKYYLSVQASMDSKITPGLFTIESVQSNLCCIAGPVIAFCTFSSIFIRKQNYRKIMFFVMSATIIFKILVIELARFML
jgi:hypothetical protein